MLKGVTGDDLSRICILISWNYIPLNFFLNLCTTKFLLEYELIKKLVHCDCLSVPRKNPLRIMYAGLD